MPVELKDRNIIEYNDDGQVIYTKDYKSGLETWKDYDVYGRLIRVKNSLGYETVYRWNSNGRCTEKIVKYYNRIIVETRYKYNENNQLIYIEDTNGFKAWFEYDENGNEISYRNSNGYEERA